MSGAPAEGGRGANLPSAWEFPLARFLERYGYDVSYTTDVDTDRNPAELLRHRLVMTAGHDEYWTKTIRDAFEAARARGINLAFMGANTGYWQMRYENGRRTIVEYRTADRDPETDPALKTISFRELGRPAVQAARRAVGRDRQRRLHRGRRRHRPARPLVHRHRLHAKRRASRPRRLRVRHALHELRAARETILFEARPPNHVDADAVRYTAPSGSVVFSSGSIRFATGLDDITGRGDARLQRFLRNALVSLLR